MFADLWISDDKLPMEYLYWLAGIPVLAWVAEIPFIHRLKPWNRELIRMLLICYPRRDGDRPGVQRITRRSFEPGHGRQSERLSHAGYQLSRIKPTTQ